MAVRPKSISKIKKCYHNEWLLFDVSKIDEQNRPLEGKLLADTVSRNAVYQLWSKIRVKLPLSYLYRQKTEKGHSIGVMTKVHFDPNEPLLIFEERKSIWPFIMQMDSSFQQSKRGIGQKRKGRDYSKKNIK